MEIRWIKPEQTHELRRLVLQRRVDKHKLGRPGDEQALHLGAFLDETLLGIASFFQQNQDEQTKEKHWRIRGMAVHPESQGKGIGKALVQFFMESKKEEIEEIWCNAREGAEGFYFKLGFRSDGLFERGHGVQAYRMVLDVSE